MNKERLLAVADIIEKGQHKFNGIHAAFNMSHWIWMLSSSEDPFNGEYFYETVVPKRDDITDPYACNTVACIAGFTCLLFDYEEMKKLRLKYLPSECIEERARIHLELSYVEASSLFLGSVSEKVTGKEAAKVIRNFVATGKVDWFGLPD